ncbi:MAG: hypothetical protein CMK92_05235 [Pseudomonas sp.]|nr:hypothetical protein [Pseudomonas sp.]
MLIRPIIQRLEESPVFKTVRFSRDVPELDSFKPNELPAVYLLPAMVRGGNDDGDLTPQQEVTQVYSFCVITAAPTNNGNDEPLAEALDDLRARLFGFQLGPEYAPFSIGDGDLFDFNTRVNAWVESYITRRTYRK